MAGKENSKQRRTRRMRFALKKNSRGKLRLSVFKSSLHIYAQVIDDVNGKTIVAASTLEKDIQKGCKKTGNVDAAKLVGAAIAERAKKVKVDKVVFDRGNFPYHGRIKALADAAREAGLQF